MVRACGTPWQLVTQPQARGLAALLRRVSHDFQPVQATCMAGLAPTSQRNLELPTAHQFSTPSRLDRRHGRN